MAVRQSLGSGEKKACAGCELSFLLIVTGQGEHIPPEGNGSSFLAPLKYFVASGVGGRVQGKVRKLKLC